MPHASYDPLRLSWYLGYIHNVYCKAGGGWGKRICFKVAKFFNVPPHTNFLTTPPPPPLLTRIKNYPLSYSVLTRKVKYGQYDEMVWRLMFKIEKYTEINATLPTPQKASGSVLKTLWSFNSNKNIIFSTSYRLWLIRREDFKRHCIPRSISINDTAIIRNFYPKKSEVPSLM